MNGRFSALNRHVLALSDMDLFTPPSACTLFSTFFHAKNHK